MEAFYLISGIFLVTVLIISAIAKVPTAHYGLEILFGKRTGKKFKEGLHTKFPIFGEVLLYPASLSTYSLEGDGAAVVTSADKLKITIDGSVQLRPDFDRLSYFAEIPEETIQHGMRDAIESGLGIIAGSEGGEDFVGKREAIEHIINCLFLLERRPDYYVNVPEEFNTNPPKSFQDYLERLEKANKSDKKKMAKISHLEAKEWKIPVKPDKTLDVLSFYKQNVRRVETMLELEGSMRESSKVEHLYGIDIAAFKMSKVTYSKDTTDAFEKKKQADKQLEATRERQAMKMIIMKDLIAQGVDANQASNDADAAVGIAPKQTISGGIPLFNVTSKN